MAWKQWSTVACEFLYFFKTPELFYFSLTHLQKHSHNCFFFNFQLPFHSAPPFFVRPLKLHFPFCNWLWYNPLTNNLSLGKETLTFSPALPTHSYPLFLFCPRLPLSLSPRHSKHIDTVWGFLLLFKLIQSYPSLSASCLGQHCRAHYHHH